MGIGPEYYLSTARLHGGRISLDLYRVYKLFEPFLGFLCTHQIRWFLGDLGLAVKLLSTRINHSELTMTSGGWIKVYWVLYDRWVTISFLDLAIYDFSDDGDAWRTSRSRRGLFVEVAATFDVVWQRELQWRRSASDTYWFPRYMGLSVFSVDIEAEFLLVSLKKDGVMPWMASGLAKSRPNGGWLVSSLDPILIDQRCDPPTMA